jgi:hypothetical protein
MVEHLIGNEEVSGSSPPNSLSRCGSAWLERYVRDVEAAGSNPVTSIFYCVFLNIHFTGKTGISMQKLLTIVFS